MRKVFGFAAAAIVVAVAIVASVVLPVPQPVSEQITLPVSRLVSCPVSGTNLGSTTVTVTDEQNFTAGVLGSLASDFQSSASFDNPEKPIVAHGGPTVSGVSIHTESGKTMMAPCSPPISGGAWNGVLTQNQQSTLVLTNVDSTPAIVDVFLYDQLGPVSIAGLRDITVPAGTTQMLAIDQLVSSESPVSVQMRASKGRVSAVLRTIGSLGYDWQTPQASADTDLVIAGLPAGEGARTLSVTNADPTQKATVTVEVLGEAGAFAPLGLETIEILPTRVVSVDMTQALGGQSSAVHLTSDLPVSAAIVSTGSDIAAVSAQPALDGAASLPAVGGTLWIANPGTTPASVQMSSDDGVTVQTTSTGVPAQSIVSLPFPTAGSVLVTTDSHVVRTSLVVAEPTLSIIPIAAGGIVTMVDAPRLAPGLG